MATAIVGLIFLSIVPINVLSLGLLPPRIPAPPTCSAVDVVVQVQDPGPQGPSSVDLTIEHLYTEVQPPRWTEAISLLRSSQQITLTNGEYHYHIL